MLTVPKINFFTHSLTQSTNTINNHKISFKSTEVAHFNIGPPPPNFEKHFHPDTQLNKYEKEEKKNKTRD